MSKKWLVVQKWVGDIKYKSHYCLQLLFGRSLIFTSKNSRKKSLFEDKDLNC